MTRAIGPWRINADNLSPSGLALVAFIRRFRWDALCDLVCRYGYAGRRGFTGVVIEPDVSCFCFTDWAATRARIALYIRSEPQSAVSVRWQLPALP